jgi:hypothetical protein
MGTFSTRAKWSDMKLTAHSPLSGEVKSVLNFTFMPPISIQDTVLRHKDNCNFTFFLTVNNVTFRGGSNTSSTYKRALKCGDRFYKIMQYNIK